MEGFFLQVLDRSISAGWLILAVVLVRFLFGKAPKWMRGILWGMVALRLVLPLSLESEFSLLPDSQSFERAVVEKVDSFTIPMNPETIMSEAHSTMPPEEGTDTYVVREEMSMTKGVNVLSIVTLIWLTGVCLLLLYCILSFWKLRRRVADAVIWRKEKPAIYESEKVDSPFVLGLIKPSIYLPYGMSDEDRKCVVAHEEAHISRGDHLIKPIGFLILAVYWFHPLVWLAYILLCRDIELACDEKVISQMSIEDKKAYTKALLECSMPQRMISACPLAFGEVGVKKRIMNVLHYKKPAFWIVVASILVCVIVGVCFLTEPKETAGNDRIDLNDESVDFHGQQQELEYPEEQKREENATSAEDKEQINEEVNNSGMRVNVLTTPPTMYLQDALSSCWNEFLVDSSTYGWSYRDEKGMVLCIDAAGKHGIGGEVKGKEWLQVHEYGIHDAPYMALFEVSPDAICIREYDLLDMGDMNPELLSETLKEEESFLELKPRRMYEITAHWQEDKFDERGFSGTAVYIFATDNYAVSGTGESRPVLIQAHVKEVMSDTDDRICIVSDTDGFSGAFIVIVPEKVYDKTKLKGGQNITITMKDLGKKESHMPVYEAIYLQPLEENGKVKDLPVMKLPSVRASWTEEVNTFSEVDLLFEKYSATEGETSIKSVTWDWMYGKLPAGQYRIVTDVIDYRAAGDFDKYYLAEEFEIMQ